jgi:predicted GNAT superfamily acetyltransferase
VVIIKRLTAVEEFKEMAALEQKVWNAPPIPYHQTYTAANNGGILLGAYDGHELVGFLYSFPGYKNGSSYLCSHMMGILPAYRKGGVGRQMKEVQREHALIEGYDRIVWTFDPLESLNAYLNLHKLKGLAALYYENHYGEVQDVLNRSLPTDRFLVEWWIRSNHIGGGSGIPADSLYHKTLKTNLNAAGFPFVSGGMSAQSLQKLEESHYTVPIPDEFQTMKAEDPQLALSWRLHTRTVFQVLIGNGYVGCDIYRAPEEKLCHYLFVKRDTLSLKGDWPHD